MCIKIKYFNCRVIYSSFLKISYETEKKEVIEYHIKADKWPFHTHLGVSFSLINQGPTVIVR